MTGGDSLPPAGGVAPAGGGGGPHGYSDNREAHLRRLRRVEGQIRGLQRMISEDVYCIDVLTQVTAATRALQAFAIELLTEHMASCVVDAAQAGGPDGEQKVREASEAIARLVRS